MFAPGFSSLPYARTFDEAYLYMDLRPCPCGESDFEKTSTTVLDEPRHTVRFGGECTGCGRYRRFTFEMPDALPDLSADVGYGTGGEPSRLLDAGEWLGIADLFDTNARELAATADLSDDETFSQVRYLASAAVAATDEAMLFLPPGVADEDAVPEGAFWSQAGRAIYELAGERFGRAALAAERAARRQAVTDLDGGRDGGQDEPD
jgi:hypothetical protein